MLPTFRTLLLFVMMSAGLVAATMAAMASVDPPPVGRCLEENADPMPIFRSSDTVVTSDYTGLDEATSGFTDYRGLSAGAAKGRLGRESAKTGERGRARVSIEIQAEPLIHGAMDNVAQAQLLASAAAEVMRKKVTGITELVAVSTQLTRKSQEAAYDRGERWTQPRFGGGRLGNRAPKTGERRYFNHSGRFAESIVGTPNKTEGTATVNVAANRLDPRTSHNAGEFAHITNALIRLVPEMADPQMLVLNTEIKEAFDTVGRSIVIAAMERNKQLRGELGAKVVDEALGLLGFGGLRSAVRSVYPG